MPSDGGDYEVPEGWTTDEWAEYVERSLVVPPTLPHPNNERWSEHPDVLRRWEARDAG